MRLRRRATNEIDWDNIAEEIESVGNEQRHAVESLLINIMQHRLQIMAWPTAAAGAALATRNRRLVGTR